MKQRASGAEPLSKSPLPNMGSSEGEKGDVTRPFQGLAQCPLVPGAGACLATRVDLAPVGDVAAEPAGIFVVDRGYLVHAKGTDPAPRYVPLLSPGLAPEGLPRPTPWST